MNSWHVKANGFCSPWQRRSVLLPHGRAALPADLELPCVPPVPDMVTTPLTPSFLRHFACWVKVPLSIWASLEGWKISVGGWRVVSSR